MPRRTATVMLAIGPWLLLAQSPPAVPRVLPAEATEQLVRSLESARVHRQHVWRDVAPLNADGSVNGFVEIARGDRRKFEFDMGANQLAIDRVMPEDVGGYPVNYGFVPQTVSYDGDPFDILVLGPALSGGQVVRGVIVGLMYMDDEKGHDSKVVLSPANDGGLPTYTLTSEVREEIADYFRKYKAWEPGKFSRVPGWGDAAEGRAYVDTTHAFFRECRGRARVECRLEN